MLRSFADGRLFGSATGTGAPNVLALHGWARSARDFDAVLAPVGADPLDAIALDLAGFGATPPPPEAWGSGEYADSVAPVFGEMARPVVVLGHSFGGRVAVHLAASPHHQQDIKALVLTGVPLVRRPGRSRPPTGFRIAKSLRKAHLIGEPRLEQARQRYGSDDYRNARGVMRQVLVRSVAENYEAQLARITCPVIMAWGDDDTAAPLAQAELAAALIPGRVDLRVLHRAGHLTPSSEPGALRQAVIEALAL